MPYTENRRKAVRVQLTPTIEAALSHFPVSVADVSVSGARIQHDTPLTLTPGKRFVLDFALKGERFVLSCTVARSRLELNPITRRMTYTTGLRFIDIDEFTIARLWSVLGCPSVDALARETAKTEPAYGFEIRSH